ncbi:hypothetical protein ACP275_04G154600 [Erythranthe tilingii]
MVRYVYFTSTVEPKNIKEAILDEFWVLAKVEELEQFSRNDIWELVLSDDKIKQLEDRIFISQSKYAKNVVSKFGLKKAKPLTTPMTSIETLGRDCDGTDVDSTLYRSLIGSLFYLSASRYDICFSVGICARYQASPKESHLSVVKRIIRYVSGTPELRKWYSKDTNNCLAGNSDADWTEDVDDRKNTTKGCFYNCLAGNSDADWTEDEDDRKNTKRGCFHMGNNLVSWYSKKQNSISLSSVASEYIAAGSCCTQFLWMQHMLNDYGFREKELHVFCDNESAINISKNPVQHSRTKHIDIRLHFIRNLVEQKRVTIDYVSTDNQLADIFTKPLNFLRFDSLRKALGICNVQN